MLVFVAGSAAAAAAPGAAAAAATGAAGEGEGAKRAAAAAAAGAQKLGHEVEELMHAVARLQKADVRAHARGRARARTIGCAGSR
jgi:hypothetical protein